MKLVYALSLLLLSSTSFARPLDTPDRATSVRDQYESQLMRLPGVQGLGIAACDPFTGEMDVTGDFVHCISVMVESQAQADALLARFPQGSKLSGIFIGIRSLGGAIDSQPRMGAGASAVDAGLSGAPQTPAPKKQLNPQWDPSDIGGPVEYHPEK